MCPYYLYYLVGRHVSVPFRTIMRCYDNSYMPHMYIS